MLAYFLCSNLILLCVLLCLGASIEHGQCRLDSSLIPLAAKSFTPEAILSAAASSRQCLTPSNTESQSGDRKTRLIYITPWNRDGYAYTSLHAQRITHVAPVWYSVQVTGSSVTIDGSHDINEEWLASLPDSTNVVPRFEVKFASKKEIEAILFFPRKEVENIVEKIIGEVTKRQYAGATLEVPYTAQMRSLVQQLGTALHAMNKELVLVIPAHHLVDQPAPFSRRDMLDVEQFVDLFSLNAYDHAGAIGKEAANAPIQWTKYILDELLTASKNSIDSEDDDPFGDDLFDDDDDKSLQLVDALHSSLNRKLLLGLNFYGYTFTQDGVMNSITAKEYTGLLEFSTMSIPLDIQWDESQAEHRMDGKIWSIWYPTLLSILYRVELAKKYGVGIGVWEAGQGLESFWDVVLS